MFFAWHSQAKHSDGKNPLQPNKWLLMLVVFLDGKWIATASNAHDLILSKEVDLRSSHCLFDVVLSLFFHECFMTRHSSREHCGNLHRER